MKSFLASLTLALAALSACQSAPVITTPLGSSRRSADWASYNMRRIGFLPIDGPGAGVHNAPDLQAALILELARTAELEFVALSQVDVEETVPSDPHRRGWYDPRTVLGLAQRYHLDGLMLTSLTHSQMYPPQRLALQMDLVSVETGLVVWSASLQLDAADAHVRQAVQSYRQTRRSMEDAPEPVEWTLLSPERFARFAAFELARLY